MSGFGGDAYWRIEPAEYVNPGPPLDTSLFDDPARLRRAWAAALERIRAQAAMAPVQRAEVLRRAEELIGGGGR